MKVIGYHGTTKQARATIEERGLEFRRRKLPKWLGTGFYFFQDAPLAATLWAKETSARRGGDTPVVLRASIDLGEAVDFIDIGYWTMFNDLKPNFGKPDMEQLGPEALFRTLTEAEREQLYYNYEDDYYVSAFVAHLEKSGQTVKAIRAAFIEGKPIHSRSWLLDRSHVQVCVRYPDIIFDATFIE